MRHRFLAALLAVVMTGLSIWAFAQQTQPASKRSEPHEERFAVSSVGSTAVMVEATTGRTWVLRHSLDHHSAAWLPLERIDEPEKALIWLEKEEILKQELAKQREASR